LIFPTSAINVYRKLSRVLQQCYSATQHTDLRVDRSAVARKLSFVNILMHSDTPPAMTKLCCQFATRTAKDY